MRIEDINRTIGLLREDAGGDLVQFVATARHELDNLTGRVTTTKNPILEAQGEKIESVGSLVSHKHLK